jgi:predicted DNA-binding WGR domain protein
VYEVDLIDYGNGLHLVNFRYGRREGNLKEGTKTVFPVSLDEAERTYDNLVASKVKKGYSENSELVQEKAPKKEKPENTKRTETILTYLDQASRGEYSRDWKVSKIILRAGELNLQQSDFMLVPFISSSDQFEQYAAIKVLAQFNYEKADEAIFKAYQTHKLETKVGRIAVSFFFKKESAFKETIFTEIEGCIPKEIVQELGNKETLLSLLSLKYINKSDQDATLLYQLYLLSFKYANLKEVVLQIIQHLPFKVNTFKSVRYMYRNAQVVNDYEILGLIDKKMALSPAAYSSFGVYVENEWVYAENEKIKKNPRIAFSKSTKDYFNKSAYKIVRNNGQNNENAFVNYASALLCSLNDELDQEHSSTEQKYEYNYEQNSYDIEQRFYPKYANCLSLMYILYGNTSRFQRAETKWFLLDGDDNSVNKERQEAHPEIWNSRKTEVLTILAHSKSDEAIVFCLAIIKDNPDFIKDIPTPLFNQLLKHYDDRVIEALLEELEKKYNLNAPEKEIVFAVLGSKSEKATELGLKWLQTYEHSLFINSEFLTQLVLIENLTLNKWIQDKYNNFISYNFPVSVKDLHPLFREENRFSVEFIQAEYNLINKTKFGELLTDITKEFIHTLVVSPINMNKVFALSLGKYSQFSEYELFKDTVQEFLDSEDEIMRKAGIELLSNFPDDYLQTNHSLITDYCFSPHPEVREAIRPAISRLIDLNPEFKRNFLSKLLNILVNQETFDGVHQNCYEILTTYYGKEVSDIDKEGIYNLILSKYEFAQRLGADLFTHQIDLNTLTSGELVALSVSDIKEIRTSLSIFLQLNGEKVNTEVNEFLRIFNTTWDDIENWATSYFESTILPEKWNLENLLYLVDHPKSKVQAFGRKMITLHFEKERGLELLKHISEHPTKEMQFFTTSFLNGYAKDNTEVILELEAFFKTILFNINENRASKKRVFEFLKEESIKNKEVAEMSLGLFNSILASISITDKSESIDGLLLIKEHYPELSIPLKIKTLDGV